MLSNVLLFVHIVMIYDKYSLIRLEFELHSIVPTDLNYLFHLHEKVLEVACTLPFFCVITILYAGEGHFSWMSQLCTLGRNLET